MKEVNAPNCGRDNDLIAFLYGELNDNESRTFRQHVHDCAACSAELASFQQVRESVVAWRDESLGGVFSPVRVADSMPTRLVGEQPSALAALREFFNLSPLWMKGAVAFALILFCLFAGLALARLQETPPAVIVAIPVNAPAEEQINAQVQRLVQAELERSKQAQEKAPAIIVTTGGRSAVRVVSRPGQEVAKARRPLSKTEREQLAADLRLVAAMNEGEIDLLNDGINQ
jgi:anti-sigma factor RsiW